MTSECVEKIGHEACGSSDALQVFYNDNEKYTGYCFSCSTFVEDPYGKGYTPAAAPARQSDEDVAITMRAIENHPITADVPRKLRVETLEYFGIRTSVLPGTEEAGIQYYPYYRSPSLSQEPCAYKARIVQNKEFFCVGNLRGVGLFGWDQAIASGARKLFITEGELDAASLYQAIRDKQKGTKWEQYLPAVVSLTRGAAPAKSDLTNHLAAIGDHFEEVILAFDMDEAGAKAVEAACKVLPMAKRAVLPAKDASAAVMEGRSRALADAVLFKGAKPVNTSIVNAMEIYDAARVQAEMGLSWPWQGLTKLTRGIRFGETYYLGAGVKMGKSEIVNTLAAHLITEHNLPVFLAKPEEANRKTVQMVLGKVAGNIFHDPEIEFDYEAYDKAREVIGDRLHMLSLYQHMGWASLRNDMLVAVEQGCKAVFIDPITNLVNGISSGETNTILQEIAQELAAFAKDQDIVVFIFCHLKAPLTGASHERGGKVHSHQFSGSRAMMRSCNLMLGLEGNKDPDLEPEERNVRRLVILEDREFGASGVVRLYWDYKTSLFNEMLILDSDNDSTPPKYERTGT